MTGGGRREYLVEGFNNELAMATVNFSVPDEVREAFNRVFAGRNKSAIIAELMREAVAREQAKGERVKAIDRLLKLRRRTPAMSAEALRRAREDGRP